MCLKFRCKCCIAEDCYSFSQILQNWRNDEQRIFLYAPSSHVVVYAGSMPDSKGLQTCVVFVKNNCSFSHFSPIFPLTFKYQSISSMVIGFGSSSWLQVPVVSFQDAPRHQTPNCSSGPKISWSFSTFFKETAGIHQDRMWQQQHLVQSPSGNMWLHYRGALMLASEGFGDEPMDGECFNDVRQSLMLLEAWFMVDFCLNSFLEGVKLLWRSNRASGGARFILLASRSCTCVLDVRVSGDCQCTWEDPELLRRIGCQYRPQGAVEWLVTSIHCVVWMAGADQRNNYWAGGGCKRLKCPCYLEQLHACPQNPVMIKSKKKHWALIFLLPCEQSLLMYIDSEVFLWLFHELCSSCEFSPMRFLTGRMCRVVTCPSLGQVGWPSFSCDSAGLVLFGWAGVTLFRRLEDFWEILWCRQSRTWK